MRNIVLSIQDAGINIMRDVISRILPAFYSAGNSSPQLWQRYCLVAGESRNDTVYARRNDILAR
jgi:hypothetical protein